MQGRSCSGEAAAGFKLGEMDVDPLVLRTWFPRRILFGSTEQRETKPMLTRYRSESAERQWEQCNLSDCIPNPGRINKKPSQEGERDANSRQRVVSVKTLPQRRACSPSLCRHKGYRNNKKKEKDWCGRERHRRRRRAACSGPCFYVTRHSFAIQSERSPSTLAQKYTVTHPDEVSSYAMFSWSLGFERSAPKHVRDKHHCAGQVRIQPVVMFSRWDRRQCLCRPDVDCWPASTPGRVGVRWSAPGRVKRCAPGGSPTPRAR